jgi:hypothetical protein
LPAARSPVLVDCCSPVRAWLTGAMHLMRAGSRSCAAKRLRRSQVLGHRCDCWITLSWSCSCKDQSACCSFMLCAAMYWGACIGGSHCAGACRAGCWLLATGAAASICYFRCIWCVEHVRASVDVPVAPSCCVPVSTGGHCIGHGHTAGACRAGCWPGSLGRHR